MVEIIDILHREELSCVSKKNGHVYRFAKRGVGDLVTEFLSGNELLNGAILADRVVGKAALIIKNRVKEIYADVISTSALDLFAENGVKVRYDKEVNHILNNEKCAWCPLEVVCKDSNDVEVLIEAIKTFMKGIQG